jgi:hypothetical protein
LSEQFDMLRAVVEEDRHNEIVAHGQFGVGA